ncbi:hypothetical protein [Flexivirga oryzae]|uniref:DUF222 domain-containing protein n=1 Tax=Flexivirga oryzae TaxID=1794944 RepID=A0A839N7U2_9MICO|nr:hypothetical protein [Flexivirga oryzae]MBB2893850.1 hypothetical protein [Flexivirga oryzae]
MTTKTPRGQGDPTVMAIDSPLHVPDHPAPVQPDTTIPDGYDPKRRPEPGLGPRLLDQVTATVQALDELPGVLEQLGDDQEADLVGVLLRLQARAGQVATLATANALDRGVLLTSDAANATQWVTGCATAAGTSIEPAAASTISVVAQACRDRRNHVIAAAVRDGSCTLGTARTALRQTAKVAEVLPAAAREDIQAWFLQLDPALGARGVTELTRRIIAKYDADKLSDEDAHLEQVESLTWRTLPTGMIRLIADLCPANAAILKQAVTALSAPQPATTTEAATSSASASTGTSDDEGDAGDSDADDGAGEAPGTDHDHVAGDRGGDAGQDPARRDPAGPKVPCPAGVPTRSPDHRDGAGPRCGLVPRPYSATAGMTGR